MNVERVGFTGAFGGLYLGIDPSLTSTGLALIGYPNVVTWRLCPPDGMRGTERLQWFWEALPRLVDRELSEVTLACVEGYSMKSSTHAHGKGELGGLVRLRLWQAGVPFHEVAPTTMKKFVTGTGAGGKSPIALHLFKRWGLTVEQEDEADAAGLCLMALHKRVGLATTKAQGEALAVPALTESPKPIRVRARVNPGAQTA